MVFENKIFDKEREFYESDGVTVISCRFEGAADGESAFKESKNICVRDCFWDLRYPFWHDENLHIENTLLNGNCRAALWYSKDISIKDSQLHGIKALRECKKASIEDSSIVSAEFGWMCEDIKLINTSATGEYFMMRSKNLEFENVTLDGKYSFQYIENAHFKNCIFNTKDAFWHGKNIIVEDSVIKGEYLAWYAEDITFINCKIEGTQPLCYCKNLRLLNCEMTNADLSFEKSEVEATLTAPIISIKNALSGYIKVPAVEEIIRDKDEYKCEIIVG